METVPGRFHSTRKKAKRERRIAVRGTAASTRLRPALPACGTVTPPVCCEMRYHGAVRRNAAILLLLFVAAVVSPAFGCLTELPMSSMPCCQKMCHQPAASPQQSMQCCHKMAGQSAPPQQTMPAPARPATVIALCATLAPAAHQLLIPRHARARDRRDFSQRLSGSPPLFELHASLLI